MKEGHRKSDILRAMMGRFTKKARSWLGSVLNGDFDSIEMETILSMFKERFNGVKEDDDIIGLESIKQEEGEAIRVFAERMIVKAKSIGQTVESNEVKRAFIKGLRGEEAARKALQCKRKLWKDLVKEVEATEEHRKTLELLRSTSKPVVAAFKELPPPTEVTPIISTTGITLSNAQLEELKKAILEGREEKNKPQEKRNSPNRPGCFICGKPGHRAMDCWHRNKRGQGPKNNQQYRKENRNKKRPREEEKRETQNKKSRREEGQGKD